MNTPTNNDHRCYVAFAAAAVEVVGPDVGADPLPNKRRASWQRPPSPTASTISSHADSAIGESSPSCGSGTPSPPSTRSATRTPTRTQQQHPTTARRTLHLSYSFIIGGRTNQATPICHVELSEGDLLTQLNKLSEEMVAAGWEAAKCMPLVAARTEDIRQIFYPFVAAHLQQQKEEGGWEIPPIFHRYVACPPTSDASPVNDEIPPITLAKRIAAIGEFITKEGPGAIDRRVEMIQQSYEAQPPTRAELYVDNLLIARVRGLPWQASDSDIALFFAGLNIAKGGIALCLSAEGRRSGEAVIRFESAEHRQLALQRHKQFLLGRYLEVYRGCGEDFMRVMAGGGGSGQGLPFTATEQQIRDFFSNRSESGGSRPDSASSPENAEEGDGGIVREGGILLVSRPDGRPSGDAFVAFVDEGSGRRALTKHKQRIGTRYIELFHTTPAEVQQLLNRSQLVIASPQSQSIVPPMGRSATGQPLPKRDCLRLRGLPYEAQVQQVVDFLGPCARHIIFQGVHMIYNAHAHPSGEALVRMDSEASATMAAQMLHNKYLEVGKKKRYIEVFTQANSLPPGGGGSGLALPNQHQHPFANLIQPQPVLSALHSSLQLQAALRASAPLNMGGAFPLFAQQPIQSLLQIPASTAATAAHQMALPSMCFQSHAGLLPIPSMTTASFPVLGSEQGYALAQQLQQGSGEMPPFAQCTHIDAAAILNLQQQQQQSALGKATPAYSQHQLMMGLDSNGGGGGDLSNQQPSVTMVPPNHPHSQFSLMHS